MIYHIFKSNVLEKIKNRKIFSYVLLLFSLGMIAGMALGYNSLWILSSITLFGIWFLILAVSQKLNSCILIDNKLFEVLGRYSYPIYLFHYLLIEEYGKFIPTLTENNVVNWLINIWQLLLFHLLLQYLLISILRHPL
jgi:peptidoglycan/LPS O-acetylase OafA/YrhL